MLNINTRFQGSIGETVSHTRVERRLECLVGRSSASEPRRTRFGEEVVAIFGDLMRSREFTLDYLQVNAQLAKLSWT